MDKTFSNGVTPFKLVMDDGEPAENMPKNPLIDKWKQEGYTKNHHGIECRDILGHYEDGRPIPNYSCVLCHSKNCYLSDGFEIPKEDKEVYDKWRTDVDEFFRLHNKNMEVVNE